MAMVGHDDDRMQFELVPVFLEAALQHLIPGCWGKLPAMVRGEGDEEGTVVLLNVRKATAVIVLSSHKNYSHVRYRVSDPVAWSFKKRAVFVHSGKNCGPSGLTGSKTRSHTLLVSPLTFLQAGHSPFVDLPDLLTLSSPGRRKSPSPSSCLRDIARPAWGSPR